MAGFRGDDRGVSEVLGAIMVFGLVLTILALVQIHAVPAANANVEANHLEQVEEDLGRLQGALSRTATGSGGEAVRLNLGTQYPSRFILVNPPPVAGEIRTGPARPVLLENVSALDDETRDYLDAPPNNALRFETQSVIYTPQYNELETPGSTVFEPGVRYKTFPGGENVQEKGMLVNGRTITLITIEGNLSETAVTSSTLTTVPLSSTSEPVGLQPASGPPQIRIPTNLSEDSWRDRVLDDQLDGSNTVSNDQFVHNISCANTTVASTQPCDAHMVITMEEGTPANPVTYDLRLAKIGVGSGYSQVDEQYITDVQGHNESIAENGTQKLIVEVRDRFNNPVSGVEVEAQNPSQGSIAQPSARRTDSDGRAAFVYEAPTNVMGSQVVTIQVELASNPGPPQRKVEFDVLVMDSDGSANIVNVVCASFPSLCPGGNPPVPVPVPLP